MLLAVEHDGSRERATVADPLVQAVRSPVRTALFDVKTRDPIPIVLWAISGTYPEQVVAA